MSIFFIWYCYIAVSCCNANYSSKNSTAATTQPALQFFLEKNKCFWETWWLFQCPVHSEHFLFLCWLFPKDPKTLIIEWLALKMRPIHSLKQNQVSTAIISGCLNNIIFLWLIHNTSSFRTGSLEPFMRTTTSLESISRNLLYELCEVSKCSQKTFWKH